MIVFLYRPSPQVPEPSELAAEKCFEAAVCNINMQSIQMAKKSVDLTWIFTQALFMALNTILWSLSYPAIRRAHPIDQVTIHLQMGLEAVNHASERWPGVQSALQLYQNLISGCLRAYSTNASYVVRSPSSGNDGTRSSSRLASSSPVSTLPTLSAGPSSPSIRHQSHSESSTDFQRVTESQSDQTGSPAAMEDSHDFHFRLFGEQASVGGTSDPSQSSFYPNSTWSSQNHKRISPAGLPSLENYGLVSFDPESVNNEIPSTIPGFPHWDPDMNPDFPPPNFASDHEMASEKPWLGSFGEAYSRYMHQHYCPPDHKLQSLSEQQQIELMSALEQDQLPDISMLMADAATSYTVNIT